MSIIDTLHIQYPIISAPMANVAGGVLASHVSKAGGLGMIGGGYCDHNFIQRELDLITHENFGIGFITWRLKEFPNVLDLSLAYQPRAIMLSFGDITPFVKKIKAQNIILMCQVQTVEQAIIVKDQGADIIVAQGSEAGGHGASRGTMSLVPAIVDQVGRTPVVAAGGIADARGVAASFQLGAKAVLIGTRFYASNEALGSENIKQQLVKETGDNTFRSNIFDYARGYVWPKPYTARTIKNEFSKQWQDENNLLEKITPDIQQNYQHAVSENNTDIAGVFAGESIDLIHEVLSVDEIMQQLILGLK